MNSTGVALHLQKVKAEIIDDLIKDELHLDLIKQELIISDDDDPGDSEFEYEEVECNVGPLQNGLTGYIAAGISGQLTSNNVADLVPLNIKTESPNIHNEELLVNESVRMHDNVNIEETFTSLNNMIPFNCSAQNEITEGIGVSHCEVHVEAFQHYAERRESSVSSYLNSDKSNDEINEFYSLECEHNQIESNQLICNFCNKSFSRKSTLIKHLRKHEKTKNSSNREICDLSFTKSLCNKSISQTSKLVHKEKKSFCCDICNGYFRSRRNLLRHMPVHSKGMPFKCDICKKLFSQKRYLTRHIDVVHQAERYHCVACDKYFKDRLWLERHVYGHSCESKIRCKCNLMFSDKICLFEHISSVHREENCFACKICKRSFTKTLNLSSHMQRVHLGKEFVCDICEKAFKQKNSLLSHIRIHTGEKPFSCDVCHKSFRCRNILSRHKFTHTGEYPFICDVCNKSFSRRYILLTHMRDCHR